MSLRGSLALASFTLLASACTAFPTIPTDVCGNKVLEVGEDCDVFATYPKGVCRDPGTVDQCHWDCSVHDGKRLPCPVGWGCDSNSTCRKPSGGFEPASNSLDLGAWSLSAGDFDGDHREDVMSAEPLDSIGMTRLRFYYFDEKGEFAEAHRFPKMLLTPTIADLSSDGTSDVTFATGLVSMMQGRRDRAWVPETFSSYQVTGARVRVVPVFDQSIQDTFPFVPLIDRPSGAQFKLSDNTSPQLLVRAELGGKIADLVADPKAGNVFEDSKHSPCAELVFALRGASHFTVMNTCDTDPLTGAVVWRAAFERHDIELQPPAAIDQAPLLVDLDGDSHLDVLLRASGKTYVSHGDGSALPSAEPVSLPTSDALPPSVSQVDPMPLAVADFTADGAPDFVFPEYLLTSSTAYAGALPVYAPLRNVGAPWTSAVIADFNANGTLDVVAASNAALNVQFFNGLGKTLVGSTVSTSAAVQALAVGDFDSDLINDLGLLEVPPAGQSKSVLKIAYGAAFMPLADPVAGAELPGPEALVSFAQDGSNNLVVCSNQGTESEPRGAITFLGGAVDRVPFAPLILSEFSSTGSVDNSRAFAVAVGNYTERDRVDVLTLAVSSLPLPPDLTRPIQIWSLSDPLNSSSFPVRLPFELDSSLRPVKFLDPFFDYVADIATTSADLNGDGRDEAVFIAPVGSARASCGLQVLGAAPGSSRLSLAAPVLLDDSCPDAQVGSFDPDGRGFSNLLLLTGQVGATDRKLYVLWNDGEGGFSSSSSTLLSSSDDSPRAFTVLPGSEQQAFSIAYITDAQIRLVGAARGTRDLLPLVSLPHLLSGATGIVAADVNGDLVKDLVISESGKLRVLKAELESR